MGEALRRLGAIIQYFENRNDIGFARPDTALCDASRCNYVLDRRSMFADASHIAKAELFRFRAIFTEVLAVHAESVSWSGSPKGLHLAAISVS